MSDRNRSIVVSLIGLLLSASPYAMAAEPESGPSPEGKASAISGLVADENGQPLEGALVSVFGKTLQSGALTAVTDEEGRFEVSDVSPGLYQLRAYLTGFLPSPLAKVMVEEGMRARTILMSLASLAEETAEAVVAETDEARTVAELKWILQHGRRNILRDEERWVPVIAADTAATQVASFEPRFALSGEFGVRESDFEQGLNEFPGAGAGLDARLAYARLFIPTKDEGSWLVSAQLLESALSSWAGRAEYATGRFTGHTLTGGVTYGNYVYGDLDQYRPPEAALARRPEGGGSTEWFGSAYASDSFLVGSTAVSAGLSFQYFDYLETSSYWAPSFQVSQPLGGDDTILRGGVDYLIQAPGGEDIALLSKVAYSDVYGPTKSHGRLHAETTARVQLGIEQQLSERTRVGVKVFQETATDQLVKRFTPERGSSGGHFSVSNQGDFVTRGLGVSFFQSLGAVQGTLGYRFGRIDALAGPGLPMLADAAAVASLASDDDIHDVTTTIATSIDRTRTRLNAVYRIVAHPRLDASTGASGREIDSRFSLQVYQLLPFVGWNGTRWELMVAVRDLFYEDLEASSILDEIAVIDAPRRVLGGVTVRF